MPVTFVRTDKKEVILIFQQSRFLSQNICPYTLMESQSFYPLASYRTVDVRGTMTILACL